MNEEKPKCTDCNDTGEVHSDLSYLGDPCPTCANRRREELCQKAAELKFGKQPLPEYYI